MKRPAEDKEVEFHPLEPFLPEGSRMLMLGSFPPPRSKWSMDFYYPNLQNDMWRIFGVVFFGDRDHFLTPAPAGGMIFCKDMLTGFLAGKGIALSDTAEAVVRQKGNASDKFLEIVSPRDIAALLEKIPSCNVVVTTGDKATRTFAAATGAAEPPVGCYTETCYAGRSLQHYRMPSSSRAYPLALDKKAAVYAKMFAETGFI